MDILNLTLGERIDYDIPPEAMSVVLMNGVPLIAFNFTLNAKNIADFQNGACSFGLFVHSWFFIAVISDQFPCNCQKSAGLIIE